MSSEWALTLVVVVIFLLYLATGSELFIAAALTLFVISVATARSK